jgi:hypothetical protein
MGNHFSEAPHASAWGIFTASAKPSEKSRRTIDFFNENVMFSSGKPIPYSVYAIGG